MGVGTAKENERNQSINAKSLPQLGIERERKLMASQHDDTKNSSLRKLG